MNPAYKHLGDKLRFGELTIGQIASMFVGLFGGLVFALYLSPFSAYVTLCLSVYLICLPAGAALLAGASEFDLWLCLRSMMGYRFSDGCFLPGSGEQAEGYEILADPALPSAAQDRGLEPLDLATLWD